MGSRAGLLHALSLRFQGLGRSRVGARYSNVFEIILTIDQW